MRNYFTFAGVDSRDFGVYISGQGTFSAPQKAYTFYNIPGRNGALIGSDKRLENLEVSYEAFIYKDFDENLAAFRSFLLSQDGYQRLSDSYHPDEYRMAAYVGPFEPAVQKTNDVGSFTITFSCKPQRFLISGDTRYYWLAGEQVLSGRILDVYMPLLDRSVMTETFDRPFPTNATPDAPVSIGDRISSLQILADRQRIARVTRVQDENQMWADLYLHGMYTGTVDWLAGTLTMESDRRYVVNRRYYDPGTQETTYDYNRVFSIPHCFQGPAVANPGTILACSHYSTDPNAEYRISISGSNITIIDPRFDTPEEFYNWTSSLGGDGLQIVMEQNKTYTFDPLALPESDGWVNLIARVYTLGFAAGDSAVLDTSLGTLHMQYTGMGDNMLNPTVFQSQPILRVYGSGVFDLNDIRITINTPGTYTDIDCEMMDCYEGSNNRNNNVSFSTYDFPVLYPGTNTVTIVSGNITAVEVVPRWWRV